MNTGKRIMSYLVTIVGVAAAVISFADVFPKYKSLFLILFGLFIGYALGLISNHFENATPENPSAIDPREALHQRGIVLTFLLFLAPVLLFILFLAVGFHVGFVDKANRNWVMGFGFVILFIAECVAGSLISSFSYDSVAQLDPKEESTETD